VCVIFSPQGGSGQTVLATNLSVALARRRPEQVVIVDLDLLFGHVAMLLDVVPRTALAALTPAAICNLDGDGLAHYLTNHAESSLRVLCGTLRPDDSEAVTAEHVQAIVAQLRRHFTHVVVDAGSRFSEPCLSAIEAADRVLVVVTPGPAGMRAARQTGRVLSDVLSVPAECVLYIQNQTTPYCGSRGEELSGIEIPFGGEDVSRASLNGIPLVMSRPGNPVSRAICRLALALVG
jgi:pilus assembly protein CpaE